MESLHAPWRIDYILAPKAHCDLSLFAQIAQSSEDEANYVIARDRTCSAYPAVGPEVRVCGGQFADIPVSDAVVDGNLVTAPAWPAHPKWLALFLELLGTRISHG